MRGMPFIFLMTFSLPVMAWNPLSSRDLVDVPLSKVELQKIKINAGWAKDDAQILIFELSNGLKGPIQCGVANAELNNGQTLSKVFVPKFAIPGNATRNASMPVVKGTMKSYALSCSCFKLKGEGECIKP
jgi:hypothetical protein